MAAPPLAKGQGVVEGDMNHQAEAVIDQALEEGRIASDERADWLAAIKTVGLAAVTKAIAQRQPDPLKASRTKTDLVRAFEEDFARSQGVKPWELI